MEVEGLSEHHNCPASIEHLGLLDRKLQNRLTRKLDQLHYYCLLASIKQPQSISSSTRTISLQRCVSENGILDECSAHLSEIFLSRNEFRTIVATHMRSPTDAFMELLGLRLKLREGVPLQPGARQDTYRRPFS